MPYIKQGQWQVPCREGNPVIVESNCSICGQYVEESDRVFEIRPTGIGQSLQRWTYCAMHAPKKALREEGIPNKSSIMECM